MIIRGNTNRGRNGSVLVGVLWCVALLAVLVITVLHTSRIDLIVTKNQGDSIQAHYIALAGIEKTKALLYQDLKDRQRTRQNHSGQLYNAPEQFRDVPLGRGHFSIIRQGNADEGQGRMYGISDEESRLNLNQASAEELGKLDGLTTDIAASIIDWRDSDNVVTPGGAETDYYMTLQPPYLPRNAPFLTTRELLMVKGVSFEMFAGEDVNLNGLLDPEEDDGDATYPPDNHDGVLDAGWSARLTVDSAVKNRSASGDERVNVQTADEKALTALSGVTTEIAKAIVSYRGQNQFTNIADLLNVTAAPANGNASTARTTAQPAQGAQTAASNSTTTQPSGPKMISQDLFIDIADEVAISTDDQPGAVNINTASFEVLKCLPGIDELMAQAIINYRKSAGFFPNIAHLLKVDGITQAIFKQVSPRISARSETFRILSEGRVDSSGARQRIQVIVRLSGSKIETLSYREDL